MKKTLIILTASLALNAHAIRQGTSVTITPPNLPGSIAAPNLVYGSVWQVYYTALIKGYSSNCGTTCRIVRTGNSYSVRVSAFSKNYVYVQTQPGELSLTKTEYISVSSTVRRVLVWSFATSGNTATSSCTIETQLLSKGVWKTSIPAALCLKSYISVANMDTVVD